MTSKVERITSILTQKLSPTYLKIYNDSQKHAHHAAMRAQRAQQQQTNEPLETHLRLEMVSSQFEGMNLMSRHRLIYSLVQEQLDTGLHALQITAKTQQEWEKLMKKRQEEGDSP